MENMQNLETEVHRLVKDNFHVHKFNNILQNKIIMGAGTKIISDTVGYFIWHI